MRSVLLQSVLSGMGEFERWGEKYPGVTDHNDLAHLLCIKSAEIICLNIGKQTCSLRVKAPGEAVFEAVQVSPHPKFEVYYTAVIKMVSQNCARLVSTMLYSTLRSA